MRDRLRMTSVVFIAALLAVPFVAVADPLPQSASSESQQSAHAEQARTAPLGQELPVDPKITVGVFPNGLIYYIRENRRPENRAELRLVVNAGSVLEDDDQLGLAHLLEHMAFNGTENFEKQELIDFMESIGMRLGPDINAYTSFDETVYMLQVPTDDPENMTTAFQILEDWAHSVTLEGEEIDKERGVVVEEWRLGRGAFERVQKQQLPIIFKDSRYAERLPIGTKESIETAPQDAVRRFYRDWYRPDLMAVIAVGDFDAADVEALVRRHFEDLPTAASPRPRTTYGVPDQPGTDFAIATDHEFPNTSISVYHKMEREEQGSVGAYRQTIVENLYNSMLNGRLQELTQQADPPFAFGSSGKGSLIRTKGVYALSAGVEPDGVVRGLDALLTEAARVAQFGFTETELERAKASMLRGIERAFDDRENQLSRRYVAEFTRAYLEGEPIPGIEYEFELFKRFVPEISLEAVNTVGRDWIREDNRVVVVSAPEKDDVVLPTQDELLATLEAAADKELTAYEDTVTDEPLVSDMPEPAAIVETARVDALDITEWTLANGARVVLMPTDFREDEILFRAVSPGGTSLVGDEDWVIASSAAQVVSIGGLGEFNAIDLRKKLAGKAASARPSIARYSERLSGQASPKDLETLFQLVYLTFTAPRADPILFQASMAQMKAMMDNQAAMPQYAFSKKLNEVRYGGHPRARMMGPDLLEEWDLDRSFAFYKDRFADASDFTFIFVGTIDLDTIRPLVETYLGGLPSIGREESWRDVGIRDPEGVIVEEVRAGIEPQSRTRIAWTGPFVYERQYRTTIRTMAQVLQTRLRDILREDLSGTYGVSVGAGYSWQPLGRYSVSISFGCDPERMEELVGVVFEELEKFKAEGPTDSELADVKESFLRTHETDSERNSWWIGQLAFKYQRDEDPSDLMVFHESVEALTRAMLQEAAQQYFNMDNYYRVTLYPETQQ